MKNAVIIILSVCFAAFGVMHSQQIMKLRAENNALLSRLNLAEKAVAQEREKMEARYRAENERLRGEVEPWMGQLPRI